LVLSHCERLEMLLQPGRHVCATVSQLHSGFELHQAESVLRLQAVAIGLAPAATHPLTDSCTLPKTVGGTLVSYSQTKPSTLGSLLGRSAQYPLIRMSR
jgi:hypothetical protein